MIRNRIDRLFDRFRRTGDARLLAQVFDRTAPELWRVAAHLCRDRHAAEDAVQATFLGAIEAQRDWDASRPLVPWLLGLLANRVREQRRRQQRTPDAARLERAAERDPADVAADREVTATLAAALQQIDEPYRTTLERHLVHGQAAHEIAAELAVPAGTVRMRLHRGLDRLRQKLPPGLAVSGAAVLPLRPEVLATMRAKVLGAVPGGAAVVGSGHVGSFVIGVLLMNKLTWTVLGSASVLLVAWLAWPPPASATRSAPDTGVVASDAADGAGSPELSAPSAATVAGAVVTEREAVTGPEGAGRGLLRVVVRNAGNGAPVGRLSMVVQPGLQPEVAAAFVAGGSPRASTSTADRRAASFWIQTDADGASVIDLPVGCVTFANDDLGLRRSAEVRGGEVQELQIELPVRFTAVVRVVDPEERPVAGARLVGSTGLVAFGLAAEEFGRTDSAGTCRVSAIDDVLRLRAHATGFAASASIELDERHATATLRLAAGPATVEGVVTDADGAPLGDGDVALQPLPRRRTDVAPILVRAGRDGRFGCPDVPPGQCLVVAVRRLDDGSSRLVAREVVVAAGGHAFVDLRYGGGAKLDVRLTNADGTPVAGADVVVKLRHAALGEPFARLGSAIVETDAQGCGVAADLLPGRYEVQVVHDGLLKRELELAAGAHERFEHVFGAAPGLGVRVVDRAGQPVAGWLVTLVCGTNGRRETTDADGRVRFVDVDAEMGRLTVQPDETTQPLVTRTVAIGTDLEIPIDPSQIGQGILRGQLELPSGIAMTSLQLVLVPQQPDAGVQAAVPIAVHPDAAGAFEASRLAPGTYTLNVFQPPNRTLAVRPDLVVPPQGVVDLGRVPVGTGRLEVRATRSDGRAIATPAPAVALPSLGRFVTPPDADGNALALPAESYQVLVWGEQMVPAITRAQVRLGETTVADVVAQPGAPVTIDFGAAGDGVEVGMLTVRHEGQASFDLAVLTLRDTFVRGFGFGHHELVFDGLRGHQFVASFDVGRDLAPQVVRLRRAE